jgi:hypothetical protein
MKLIDFKNPRWTNYINGIAINDEKTIITTETSIHLFLTKDIMQYIVYNCDLPNPIYSFEFKMPHKFQSGMSLCNKTKYSAQYPIYSTIIEHFGDCDWLPDGSFIVSSEGPDGPGILKFVIHEDLIPCCEYIGKIPLWNQIEAPWCAYDDKEKLIYTSDFDTDVVYAYPLEFNVHNNVPVGMIVLKDKLYRIQGGAMRDDGTLYLISDEDYNPRIISIDNTGLTKTFVGIKRNAFSRPEKIVNYFARKNIARDKELQGIAAYKGKLYQLLSDKNWFSNDGLKMLVYNTNEKT